MTEKRMLRLTLHKKWFDMIASGEKKEEYRIAKPYWDKRLRDKNFEEVHFRNGYSPTSPFMRVEWKGCRIDELYNRYVISLGKVLEVRNGRT